MSVFYKRTMQNSNRIIIINFHLNANIIFLRLVGRQREEVTSWINVDKRVQWQAS
jgi:cell division protein FtsW (lipid II flippase)